MRLLLTAALALGATTTASAAFAQPLPDFPVEARPGECWARVPVGAPHPSGPPAQAVWTLEQGQGPQAVWRFSERGPHVSLPQGAALDWARVECGSGRPLALAQAPLRESFGPAPYGPAQPPHAQSHQGPEGPYADVAPPPPVPPLAYRDHGPHMLPPHAAPFERRPFPPKPAFEARFAPRPPMHHAQHHGPHLLRPAPLFGARFLHWPGKTLR